MKNKLFIFLFDIFLVCIVLLLAFGNFFIGALVSDYGIDLLNFIALELFDKKRFYVYARGIGTGLYFAYLTILSILFMSIYNIFCYWLYSKYQGWKFFLIISSIFIAYFLLLCLFVFKVYRLRTLLLHFPAFWLTYIEIILLYRIRDKLLK